MSDRWWFTTLGGSVWGGTVWNVAQPFREDCGRSRGESEFTGGGGSLRGAGGLDAPEDRAGQRKGDTFFEEKLPL